MPEIEYRSRLMVGGQPFFPRVIEHRGEALERLQSLGFNCVRLRQPPPAELLADAARLKLWLIGPPPTVEQLRSGNIGSEYDPVLAWDLGSRLTAREFDVAQAWADAVTRADSRSRPIVCGPTSDLQNYTRPPFKVYLDEREVLGTTFNVDQYTRWLAERSQLARAGAPLWATIPTQASPALAEQMRLVAGVPVQPPSWQLAQMRAIVHAALASRSRGLCFTSYSRLDAGDVATRARAAVLELLNIELGLIERWPAAGNFAPLANTSNQNTTGAVLETDHSRLLLPIFQPPARPVRDRHAGRSNDRLHRAGRARGRRRLRTFAHGAASSAQHARGWRDGRGAGRRRPRFAGRIYARSLNYSYVAGERGQGRAASRSFGAGTGIAGARTGKRCSGADQPRGQR